MFFLKESEDVNTNNHMTDSRTSDSSEASEVSCGKIYMTIDEKREKDSETEGANEDQLLLSWQEKKSYKKVEDLRKRPPLVKQSLVQQTQEVVL